MFARFDENPAMTLEDIKETKRYRRTDGRTDNVKTVYPPQTKFAGGINIYASRSETLISILQYLVYYTLLPVAIYKLLQICENENSSLESKSLLHIYGRGTWFILICNLLSYYLQFHKKM